MKNATPRPQSTTGALISFTAQRTGTDQVYQNYLVLCFVGFVACTDQRMESSEKIGLP